MSDKKCDLFHDVNFFLDVPVMYEVAIHASGFRCPFYCRRIAASINIIVAKWRWIGG